MECHHCTKRSDSACCVGDKIFRHKLGVIPVHVFEGYLQRDTRCLGSGNNSGNMSIDAATMPRRPRLPPTPPLHKRKRGNTSLLSRAKSTLRTWFQQPALVLNESQVEDEDCESWNGRGIISKEEMLNVAEEVRSRIGDLYSTALNVDSKTGDVTVDYVKVVHSVDFWKYLQVTKKLRYIDPSLLCERERTAFFLNLYNALMIHGIVQLPKPKNVFQRLSIFDIAAYNIGGRIYTLNDIEHGVLRANKGNCGAFATKQFEDSDARVQCVLPQVDPRIHFALNCGARSCPSIRCYNPENLNQALDSATKTFLLDVQVDVERREVVLSQMLRWYQDDFASGGTVYDVLKWTLPFLEEEKRQYLQIMLEDHENGKAMLKVNYASYDWSLNDSFCWWQ
eukprot:Plantae.Rhodophyta-Hildenbrandia_rubra.ctg2362.p1 GENE.Plantae.Rhodophyta-Hildenbrandia_rubra.ctg2362~~Plantae.Rhodophyta-Hildenbrandia_rubra.ctg2362.p1  ORF type:complete len:394 (+),score=53.22 Plantae.Rhodophyta-Hildenbrandia_rubra.ctg2362:1182-2363(+)